MKFFLTAIFLISVPCFADESANFKSILRVKRCLNINCEQSNTLTENVSVLLKPYSSDVSIGQHTMTISQNGYDIVATLNVAKVVSQDKSAYVISVSAKGIKNGETSPGVNTFFLGATSMDDLSKLTTVAWQSPSMLIEGNYEFNVSVMVTPTAPLQ